MESNETVVRRRRRARVAGLLAIALSSALCSLPVAAVEEGTTMSKADVERLMADRKFEFVRLDGVAVAYDVREGGKVYYSPPRSMRNLSISGTYTIDDEGALCMKWSNTTKDISMTDRCYRFRRDSGKVHVLGGREGDKVVGDLAE